MQVKEQAIGFLASQAKKPMCVQSTQCIWNSSCSRDPCGAMPLPSEYTAACTSLTYVALCKHLLSGEKAQSGSLCFSWEVHLRYWDPQEFLLTVRVAVSELERSWEGTTALFSQNIFSNFLSLNARRRGKTMQVKYVYLLLNYFL